MKQMTVWDLYGPSDSDKDINDCDKDQAAKCWEITPANLPTKDSVLTDYQNVFALGEFYSVFVYLSLLINWNANSNDPNPFPGPQLVIVLGWGLYDASGDQSRYLRQVYLTVNTSITDCDCPEDYHIQTNVGPRGEDPCAGDSGRVLTSFIVDFKHHFMNLVYVYVYVYLYTITWNMVGGPLVAKERGGRLAVVGTLRKWNKGGKWFIPKAGN